MADPSSTAEWEQRVDGKDLPSDDEAQITRTDALVEDGAGQDASSSRTNPQLWSPTKKLCHIVPVGMMVFAVTLGSSIISAGAPEIGQEFHVSSVAPILPFVSKLRSNQRR